MSLAGAVGSVAGSCPSLTLQFGPTTVTTGASTTFAGVACGSIKRNDRLGVVGTTQAGGAVAASCITGL
jgi:hypothetical protein